MEDVIKNLPKIPPRARSKEQRQKAINDMEFDDDLFFDIWAHGIDLASPDNHLKTYASWKRYYYERNTQSHEEYFLQDFQGWNEAAFNRLSPTLLTELREILREKGVYIPKRRGLPIAKALVQALTEELEWPEDERNQQPKQQELEQQAGERVQQSEGGQGRHKQHELEEIRRFLTVPDPDMPNFTPRRHTSERPERHATSPRTPVSDDDDIDLYTGPEDITHRHEQHYGRREQHQDTRQQGSFQNQPTRGFQNQPTARFADTTREASISLLEQSRAATTTPHGGSYGSTPKLSAKGSCATGRHEYTGPKAHEMGYKSE